MIRNKTSYPLVMIVAAAGLGRRMGTAFATTPKPIIQDPVTSRPLLHHMMDRVSRAGNLDEVVIVGRREAGAGKRVAQCAKNRQADKQPAVRLCLPQLRGPTHALMIGLQCGFRKTEAHYLLTMGDTLAERYPSFEGLDYDVLIGVNARLQTQWKKFTPLWEVGGDAIFTATPQARVWGIRGVYLLRSHAAQSVLTLLRQEWRKYKQGCPLEFRERWDRNGEMHLSWVWPEVVKQGMRIGVTDLGEVAEVNTPEDLVDLGRLVAGESLLE
ncbi:NTP transferase domain-containing protein [Candidatus Uhrbacteria bacterium]|nr:NTP transferase domain-containing protein [Candidatus Uhrbacteria bacterium]